MEKKSNSVKTLLAVSISLLLVVGILAAFFLSEKQDDGNAIILPETPTVTAAPEPQETEERDPFVEVTAENALSVLRSMERPVFYHQTYTISVGADETQAVSNVELWVNGGLVHAEITAGNWVKSIVTDGETAYLWYDTDPTPIAVALSADLTTEDLLGLPSHRQLLQSEQEAVVGADYVVLEDPRVQCIYVCIQESDNRVCRYWIDVETGLLYKTDCLERSRQIYAVYQEQMENLAAGDQAYQACFQLPDGSRPFD